MEGAPGPSPSEGEPRVSVVIPVRNDAVRLRKCLEALDAQTFAERFEVIVVDNGSRDDPHAVVAEHPRARLVSESEPSSYAARNLGVRHVRSEVLAFTDADCVPSPDWVERGHARVAEAGDDAFVAGRVDVFVPDPDAPTAAELYELVHAFPQERYAREYSFAATANLWVGASGFQRVGEFNSGLVSSGDLEWGQRARRAGMRGTYADDVRVAHPARRSLSALSKKKRRLQMGDLQLRRLRGEPTIGLETVRLLVPPVRTIARNLSRVRPASAGARARYAGVVLFTHYIGVYERLRIARGRLAS